jgi:signal transduction histidine kinase
MMERVAVDDRLVALRKHWSWNYSPQARLPIADLKSDTSLRLPPSHRRVAIDFAALSYAAPENVRYRYRLENFDNDWTETANEHTARYSRLPAGEYRFRVIACNDSGVWNETGAAVSIVVDPFFWQTWWFRLAVLAAFTLAVALLVRWLSFRRLRAQLTLAEQQAALSEERARIAQDIHDDLGGSLAHIKFLSEAAAHEQAANPAAAEPLRHITATVRQILKSLDEIVWAINPRNDSLPDLISYLGHYAADFLRTAGVQFELELPDNPPTRAVGSDVRHHVFLLVKEALTNVARHAAARKVRLEVRLEGDALSVVIRDDGRGFDPARAGSAGDGLQNMRKRMAAIGGRIEFTSTPGSGTQLRLTVPTGAHPTSRS